MVDPNRTDARSLKGKVEIYRYDIVSQYCAMVQGSSFCILFATITACFYLPLRILGTI